MKKIDYVSNIRKAKISIYDELPHKSNLRIPTPELEKILKKGLVNLGISNLAIRSRSRFVKESVCKAMGYDTPSSFQRVKPRFPGQDLDVYTQKSRNLQIWNEQIIPSRRYAIIILDSNSTIYDVKVLTGQDIQALDKTGKLTTKYQAIFKPRGKNGLLSENDSNKFDRYIRQYETKRKFISSPLSHPQFGEMLPINELYKRLKKIEGKQFSYTGAIQERNRGSALHKMVCEVLGYSDYEDDGRFPDVTAQLLEVKLQTSKTIDLGLILPTDLEPIEGLNVDGIDVTPSDIRYAVFDAERVDGYTSVRIKRVYLVIGSEFFNHFQIMKGKVKNQKLQIPLPVRLFPKSE
jgi:hypothetical protein